MEDAAKIEASGPESSWSGGSSGVAKPAVRTIEDAEAWKALWKDEFAREAPQVDFKTHFAVAVFLGLRRTGGYGVEFLPPFESGGGVTIPYRVKSPAPGAFVIQAFTQPYAIRLYKKTGLRVAVEEKP